MKWADYVGREFKAFSSLYECVEYDPRKGLCMKLLDEKSAFGDRKRGDVTWVSERAIDRTYHTVY